MLASPRVLDADSAEICYKKTLNCQQWDLPADPVVKAPALAVPGPGFNPDQETKTW